MNSAAQDHIISVKGPELCGRQKRSERPREAGLGHRPSHLMRLGVFAYPQLVLTSSPESPRNPSGQRKPSEPGGGYVVLDNQRLRNPSVSYPAPPSLAFHWATLRALHLEASFCRGTFPPTARRSVPAEHSSRFHGNHIFLGGLTGPCLSPPLHAHSPAQRRCPQTAPVAQAHEQGPTQPAELC